MKIYENMRKNSHPATSSKLYYIQIY